MVNICYALLVSIQNTNTNMYKYEISLLLMYAAIQVQMVKFLLFVIVNNNRAGTMLALV